MVPIRDLDHCHTTIINTYQPAKKITNCPWLKRYTHTQSEPGLASVSERLFFNRLKSELTIDPFGLWVVDLEVRLEQILHSQFGVTSCLVVSCENIQMYLCSNTYKCVLYILSNIC